MWIYGDECEGDSQYRGDICAYVNGSDHFEEFRANKLSIVIVRRVVEARRQHYQSQQLAARMGSSTARTPALTVSERQVTDPQQSKDGQRRRGFPLFGGKKDASKRVSFVDNSSKEGGEQGKPPKNEGDDDEAQSWWRRLICV